jgi:hypothetical protein
MRRRERPSLFSRLSEVVRRWGWIGLSVPQSNEAQGRRALTEGADVLSAREEKRSPCAVSPLVRWSTSLRWRRMRYCCSSRPDGGTLASRAAEGPEFPWPVRLRCLRPCAPEVCRRARGGDSSPVRGTVMCLPGIRPPRFCCSGHPHARPTSVGTQDGTRMRKRTGRRVLGLREDGSPARATRRRPKGHRCGKALSRVRSAVCGCCTITHHAGRLELQRPYAAVLLTAVFRLPRKGQNEPFASRDVIFPASGDESRDAAACADHRERIRAGRLRVANVRAGHGSAHTGPVAAGAGAQPPP